jgi:hypothetical protein
MHLKNDLVSLAFRRLDGPKDGKTHLERTSAVMYFLAVCASLIKTQQSTLDVNPGTSRGLSNRKALELEYAKLVMLNRAADGQARTVFALGRVTTGGRTPEKAISSNFLTVPVKNASRSSAAYQYPKRPAPLLVIGKVATGETWGIGLHENWRNHLPRFFEELKSNTPFTDMAVFMLRDNSIAPSMGTLQRAVEAAFETRFGPDVSEYWSRKISAEKIFSRHTQDPFHSGDPSSNRFDEGTSGSGDLDALSKKELIERVHRLENLLKAHGLTF